MGRIYSAFVGVVAVLVLLPWHLGRVLVRRDSISSVKERFGLLRSRHTPGEGLRILIHAVSVGEVGVAGALLGALQSSGAWEVFLSVGNQAGRARARAYGPRFSCLKWIGLLPWDAAPLLRRWLRQINPAVVAVIETELWPGLFFACRDLGIPLVILNGRIYSKDVPRYRLAKPFFHDVMRCPSRVLVQNEPEARRFRAIGTDGKKIRVVGNLKFVRKTEPGVSCWSRSDEIPILLAASTHDPEEKFVIEAFTALETWRPTRLVIAPRDVRRVPQIEALVRQTGFEPVRWSTRNGRSAERQVVIVDRYGVLPRLYRAATLAVVGGSFVPKGGHDFLEAAHQGCPIVIGPHLDHFEFEARLFVENSAFVQVSGPERLGQVVADLLVSSRRREELASRARQVVKGQQGALGASLDAIWEVSQPHSVREERS
jgi:3-deoxy-D-manno-octulosonic-acid transferase